MKTASLSVMVLAAARSHRRMAASFLPVRGSVCVHPPFFSSCFSSLEHLIQINSCYLMLRLLLLIHTSPPSDHSPVPFHRSLFSSPSFFFLILSIPHVPTSSAPPPPPPSLISSSFLPLPVSPPCQPWPS